MKTNIRNYRRQKATWFTLFFLLSSFSHTEAVTSLTSPDGRYVITVADAMRYSVTFDGKTIVDRIKVRHDLPANVSFGRTEDGIGSVDGKGEGWAVLKRTSPSTNNAMVDKAAKPDRMKQIDPYGWIMALTAMSVVFTALILLYFLFKAIGNANIKASNKKAAAAAGAASVAAPKTDFGEVPAETYAAIATAMHLYMVEEEAHDEEPFVVTMNPVDRTYTPWSTHIQGFRQTPTVIKKK